VLLFGTDQRITSGPAAKTAALKGRIHGCTRTIRKNVRFFSCTAGAVHTWHFAAEQGMSVITENVGYKRPSVGAFSTALPLEDHQPHWFFGMQTDMKKDSSK
jgi:hypothetical protein